MKNNPKLSIIVPIYNAEKYIDRCMNSIYAQTFTDYEIILVNDGSKDKSAEICRKYESEDERVIFVDKENGGAGSARNAGMAVASGRYLAFPDVDDWFEPDMYEALYKIADSGDFDMVFSGVNYYSQTPDGLKYSCSEYCKNVSYVSMRDCRKNVMDFFPTTTIFDVPWNKLYKRSIVTDNDIKFTDIRRCQDAMFNIDFYAHINSVSASDKAFYNYMENTVADVQRKFPKDYIDINIFYYTHLIELLKSWGIYKDEIKLHYDSSFVISVYTTANMFDNPRWELSKEQKMEYVSDILNRKEITDFLPNANVREEYKKEYEILVNRDVKKLFSLHNKEKIKDIIRKNKAIMAIYHSVRG